MKLFLWIITVSISLTFLSACANTNDPTTPSLKSFEAPKTYGNNAMTIAHKM
jgi:hypothetical protein